VCTKHNVPHLLPFTLARRYLLQFFTMPVAEIQGPPPRNFPAKFKTVKRTGTSAPMTPGMRIIVLISVAIMVIVALSLSGQVHPLYNEPGPLDQQNVSDPTHPAPSFIMTVTPREAHARPGDPVDCEVLITPENGFAQPVELELEVDAGAVFRGTYNAGVMYPPYPRTYEYRVVVPSQAPAPLTVHGTLHGTGGGHSEEVDLVLFVEP
jgi:hypothetical protein